MKMFTVWRPRLAAAASLLATAVAIIVGSDHTAATESSLVPESVAAPDPQAAMAPDPPAPPLGPVAVQCGAARASSTGNLLASQGTPTGPPRHACGGPAARQNELRRIVFGLAAEEARNRDAGAALELYWSLAEAQHSLSDIENAADVVDKALADRAEFERRGLELPFDDSALRSRRLDLTDAMITATATVDAVATAIAPLAGLPAGPVTTVHPSSGRAAVDDPLDVEALVAEGLARRPELRMLRATLARLDRDTVAVARQALALVNPALGGGGPSAACGRIGGVLHRRRREEEEVAQLRRSLRCLLRDRERAVAAEIRQAARLAEAAAERVATAEQRLALGERTAADLRARQGVGDSDAFAVHQADLEVIAARQGIVERLAEWERARTKLWQAQGVLAAPCCP